MQVTQFSLPTPPPPQKKRLGGTKNLIYEMLLKRKTAISNCFVHNINAFLCFRRAVHSNMIVIANIAKYVNYDIHSSLYFKVWLN
jgi:hypothetical protein